MVIRNLPTVVNEHQVQPTLSPTFKESVLRNLKIVKCHWATRCQRLYVIWTLRSFINGRRWFQGWQWWSFTRFRTFPSRGQAPFWKKCSNALWSHATFFCQFNQIYSLEIETNIKTLGEVLGTVKTQDSIPGLTAKPSLSRTSFFTWIKWDKKIQHSRYTLRLDQRAVYIIPRQSIQHWFLARDEQIQHLQVSI